MASRQILAMGGGGFMMEPGNTLLDDHVLSLIDRRPARICFLPTACGDAPAPIVSFFTMFSPPDCEPSFLSLFRRSVDDMRSFLLEQDAIYVGGGNTANMLAVWHAHGLDAVLREVWEAGVLLTGLSAGALCWFESGITDSFGLPFVPLRGAVGLLPGSFCPHWDSESGRRAAYHAAIRNGLEPGWAADDGAALHFVDGSLAEVVTSRPKARAFRIERGPDGILETPLATRYLGDEY